MSYDSWDDYAESQAEFDAEQEYLARIPTDLHEEAVRSYLGSCGDAVDARVKKLLSAATSLSASKFPGPSVVVSATILEVMIRYFCVRPIFEAAFLSDLIAREVTEKITRSHFFPERNLLAGILRPWKIELNEILLGSGKPLWNEFTSVVLENRNNFVHRGQDVSDEIAAIAIECATEFRAQIVMAMANRLGFTHDKSGCWSKVITDPKEHVFLGGKLINGETTYVTRSPFV
ncbi:MAG: hypothetical protein LAN18_11380 [Acidobacteriia bacterium]|nr:hypothetical protein [Terriglobia bacterium]